MPISKLQKKVELKYDNYISKQSKIKLKDARETSVTSFDQRTYGPVGIFLLPNCCVQFQTCEAIIEDFTIV
jgi:hypothetical protein